MFLCCPRNDWIVDCNCRRFSKYIWMSYWVETKCHSDNICCPRHILPDTFASKAAAVGEKYADNAIGNITGSNSVNVFLGLGLPWLIASIYHEVVGTENGFEMKDKSLSFSVLVFTICALSTLVMLMIRRYVGFFGKAELGGPDFARFLSSGILVILWLAYVGLATMQAYGKIDPL